MRSIFLLLLSAACLLAQQDPAPISIVIEQGTQKPFARRVAQQDLGSIEGIVIEEGTQKPVPFARLQLRTLGSGGEVGQARGAISAEDGRFAFANVEPARYMIIPGKNGWARPDRVGQPAPVVTVERAQHLNGVIIELVRTPVIIGRVTDQAGEPLSEVYISAMVYRSPNGQRRLESISTARTDDQGQYRMHSFPPGEYYLSATVRTGALVAMGSAPPVEYYPGVQDESRAEPVKIGAGEQLNGMDFRVTINAAAGVTVSGRIVVPEDTQVLMAQVALIGESLATRSMSRASSTGEFKLSHVPPGQYQLLGLIRVGNETQVGAQPVQVGGVDIEGIQLTPRPPVSFPVTSTVEPMDDNFSVAGTRVTFSQTGPSLPLGGGTAVLDASGQGLAQIMMSGRMEVSVTMPGSTGYLKSATQGGRDALADGVEITGEGPTPLKLVFGSRGAEVRGVVTNPDGNPAIGAVIVLLPEESKSSRHYLYQRITSDQRGRYRLYGVTPGTYRAVAVAGMERGREFEPEFAEAFKEKFVTVAIGEGEQKSLDLTTVK